MTVGEYPSVWSYGLADFMESMQVRKGKLEAEWLTSRSITLKESVALTPSIRHIERPLEFEPEKNSDSAWLEHDAMRRWTDIVTYRPNSLCRLFSFFWLPLRSTSTMDCFVPT